MSSPPPDVRQNSSSPQNIFWDCSTAQNLQQGLHMKRKGQLFCKTVKGSILSIQHRPQPAEQSCLALTGVGAPESCDSQHQPSPAQGSASLAPARDRESSHLLHTQQEFLHTDPHWQNWEESKPKGRSSAAHKLFLYSHAHCLQRCFAALLSPAVGVAWISFPGDFQAENQEGITEQCHKQWRFAQTSREDAVLHCYPPK